MSTFSQQALAQRAVRKQNRIDQRRILLEQRLVKRQRLNDARIARRDARRSSRLQRRQDTLALRRASSALRRIAKAKRRESKNAARNAALLARRNRASGRAQTKMEDRDFKTHLRHLNSSRRQELAKQRKAERDRLKAVKKKTTRQRTRWKAPNTFTASFFNDIGEEKVSERISIDYFEDVLTDYTIRPCNLSRFTRTPASGVDITKNNHFMTYVNSPDTRVSHNATYGLIVPYLFRLKNKKLATSNDANLLLALAEADDTLNLLKNSYRKPPTYGSAKWGWMPLISDIVAVNDAHSRVQNSLLEGNKRTSRYVTKDVFTIKSKPMDGPGGLFVHTWEVSVKYSGSVQYDNDILAFYDYLGFHPSPKLAWDLVPLSFAIDWILPVGDMLKALTPPQGWVKAVNFTGWHVVTATLTEKCVEPGANYLSVGSSPSIKMVSRNFVSGIALEEKLIRKPIEVLKVPTLEQIMNLSYLSDAFYKRGRNLAAPHVYKKKSR